MEILGVSDEVVGRLLKGSENINRMRDEIDQFVRMLIGMSTLRPFVSAVFPFPGGKWILYGINIERPRIYAECLVDTASGWVCGYNSDRSGCGPSFLTEQVADVHCALQYFLQLMLNLDIRNLKDRLGVLLRAS